MRWAPRTGPSRDGYQPALSASLSQGGGGTWESGAVRDAGPREETHGARDTLASPARGASMARISVEND